MSNCTKEAQNDAVKPKNDAIDSISRSDAIAVVRKNHYRLQGKGMTEEVLIADLEALPSADRTGEWVDDKGRPYKGKPNGSCWCGKCGEWLVASDEYNVSTSYCPNCGVRMLNGGE